MPITSGVATRHLKSRSDSMRRLPGTWAHPEVAVRIERATKVLDACAEFIPELVAEFPRFVKRRRLETAAQVAASKSAEARAWELKLLGSEYFGTLSLTSLIDSADHIGTARDLDALEALGSAAYGAGMQIALSASGVEILKAVAELAGAAADIADTGRAASHRAEQARSASSFLMWIDAVISIGMVWLVGAEAYIATIRGEGDASAELLANRVFERIRLT